MSSNFKWKNKYIINYYFYNTIFVDVIFEILTISMTNVYVNMTNFVLSGICFVVEYCRDWKVSGCKFSAFQGHLLLGEFTLGERVALGIEKVLVGSKNILNFIPHQCVLSTVCSYIQVSL